MEGLLCCTAAKYSNHRDRSQSSLTAGTRATSPTDLSDRPARSSHRGGTPAGRLHSVSEPPQCCYVDLFVGVNTQVDKCPLWRSRDSSMVKDRYSYRKCSDS